MMGSSEQLEEASYCDVTSLGRESSDEHHPLQHELVLPPTLVGSNIQLGPSKSYSPDPDNAPVSALVRQIFGTPKPNDCLEASKAWASKLKEAEAAIQRKVLQLEDEVLSFKNSNKKLGIMLKENAQNRSRLMQEKAAWKIQRDSDIKGLQELKEAEMSKIQKDKCRVEHQIQTLAQLPTKEERQEICQLKAKLVAEHEAHHKKELQWRQSNNSLREANKTLKNQVRELKKQIEWHEDQLLLGMGNEEEEVDNDLHDQSRLCDKTPTLSTHRNPATSGGGSLREKGTTQREARSLTQDEGKYYVGEEEHDVENSIQPAKAKVQLIKKLHHPSNLKVEVTKKLLKNNNEDELKLELCSKGSKTYKKDSLDDCEQATTELTQRMRHLEKEVEQWINVHDQAHHFDINDKKIGPSHW